MNAAVPGPGYTDKQRGEAADWFVAIRDSQDPGGEALQDWLRWLEADEGNRLAFEAVEEAWQRTSSTLDFAMPSEQEIAADSYDGTVPITQWRTSARHPLPRKRGRVREGARLRWFVPASMVAALVGILFLKSLLDRSAPGNAFSSVFTTHTAEHLEVALPDGSRVSLGAKSRIAVDFTGDTRTIRLTGGEAFFSVNKDKARPFVVHALNGTITALGTAFNVRTASGRVMVAITEGKVRVEERVAPSSSGAPRPAAEVLATAGQQLSFGLQTSTPAVEISPAAQSGGRTRWREGWLVYRNEPLRAVIDDISRYTDRTIDIPDAAAGELRFSGAVYKTDIDEWLSALPESFPVSIRTEGAHLTIRYSSTAQPTVPLSSPSSS